MKYDNIQSSSNILEKFFSGLLSGKIEEFSSFDRGWQKILCQIPNKGEDLATHSNLKEIKNNILFVETDHPAWVQLFNFNKKRILKIFNEEFKEFNAKDIHFTIKND